VAVKPGTQQNAAYGSKEPGEKSSVVESPKSYVEMPAKACQVKLRKRCPSALLLWRDECPSSAMNVARHAFCSQPRCVPPLTPQRMSS